MDRYETLGLLSSLPCIRCLDDIDKLYITHGEWSSGFGGATVKREEVHFKGLPFDCCALSLKPFSDPVCTPEGIIFDILNIVPYIRKYGTNPVTGEPLDVKSLLKLNIQKNADGEYYCPITLKTLNDNVHIVANKKTGNVYEKEGVETLGAGSRTWTDFITGEPFTREDLLTLQDPNDLGKKNIIKFHHLRDTEKESKRPQKPESQAASADAAGSQDKTVGFTTTGKVAASLTSTGMTPVTVNELSRINAEEAMFRAIKKPGKAIVRTNLGDLTFELACHKVPRTCYNFIELSKRGYYQNVCFHRLVPGFMVQGGDSTGEGSGGESIWGKPFDNEFHQSLSHNKRGILSMANRGRPFTNTSQFFIIFDAKHHLDKIHPVFGHLIAGEATLDAIEAVPVVDGSRPSKEIRIIDAVIMDDPFEEYRKGLCSEANLEAKKKRAAVIDPTVALKRAKASVNTPFTIGKYINKNPT